VTPGEISSNFFHLASHPGPDKHKENADKIKLQPTMTSVVLITILLAGKFQSTMLYHIKYWKGTTLLFPLSVWKII